MSLSRWSAARDIRLRFAYRAYSRTVDPTARAQIREAGGNLPVDMTSFVGRRREITLTKRLLAESRLVTLTGPGGVGKTRLALRVAANMRRSFRDRAWLVRLDDLRDPSLVADTVGEQLEVRGHHSVDHEVGDIVEHLRSREMLLVLDNCEHLVDEVARFVETLLQACPGVRVLATSRQSLGVAGESVLVVPPLQVPDLEHLPPPEAYEQYSSVRLFVDRAQAALPEFEADASNGAVLMRLCHHLDGNPLAIELAAVRLRSLSLEQLEERLAERYELLTGGPRGAPKRQQTLRALIDWSYDLCPEQDRLAWARMSVFSGSFDLEAAEHVTAGGSLRVQDVLGAVHSLVDQSILLREDESGVVRYRLLQAMREYGQERLAASGEAAFFQRRHREWYALLVERFATEWLGGDQPEWVQRLRLEQGNLRVAMSSATGSSATGPEDASIGLRMATQLDDYWSIRGFTSEARYWLDLALSVAPQDSQERTPALRVDGWFALLQGDTPAGERLLAQAGQLAERYGDEIQKAYVGHALGMSAMFQGRLSEARALFEQNLAAFRASGELRGELFSLVTLGLVASRRNEGERALGLLSECVDRTTQRGEIFFRSYALWATAYIEALRDRLDEADRAAKDALRLQRRLDNKLAMALTIDTLAWIGQRRNNNERAARLFGVAHTMWNALNAAPEFYTAFQSTHDEHVEWARAALGEAAYQDAFERGMKLPTGMALDYALEVKRHAREAPRDNVTQMPLTRREREIAELVAQGRTNKEIAESLVIAQRTVEGHVQHILTKLDFSSRAQIASWVAARKNSS